MCIISTFDIWKLKKYLLVFILKAIYKSAVFCLFDESTIEKKGEKTLCAREACQNKPRAGFICALTNAH